MTQAGKAFSGQRKVVSEGIWSATRCTLSQDAPCPELFLGLAKSCFSHWIWMKPTWFHTKTAKVTHCGSSHQYIYSEAKQISKKCVMVNCLMNYCKSKWCIPRSICSASQARHHLNASQKSSRQLCAVVCRGLSILLQYLGQYIYRLQQMAMQKEPFSTHT